MLYLINKDNHTECLICNNPLINHKNHAACVKKIRPFIKTINKILNLYLKNILGRCAIDFHLSKEQKNQIKFMTHLNFILFLNKKCLPSSILQVINANKNALGQHASNTTFLEEVYYKIKNCVKYYEKQRTVELLSAAGIDIELYTS